MYGRTNATPWLACPRPRASASLRLFCFPYSGAGASIYYPWAEGMPPFVELCPIQLPGREVRLEEPPYTQLTALVEATKAALLPYLDRPFALFGHSMGALAAYELARSLSREGKSPVHLFVSGHGAPQLPEDHAPIHALPQDAFIAELRKLQGMPEAVLENSELCDILIPILRADFAMCETYQHEQGEPLACPISAMGGLSDSMVTRDHLQAWQEQTTGHFSLHMFPGDHFYLHTSRSLLLQTVLRHLSQRDIAQRED